MCACGALAGAKADAGRSQSASRRRPPAEGNGPGGPRQRTLHQVGRPPQQQQGRGGRSKVVQSTSSSDGDEAEGGWPSAMRARPSTNVGLACTLRHACAPQHQCRPGLHPAPCMRAPALGWPCSASLLTTPCGKARCGCVGLASLKVLPLSLSKSEFL